MTLTDKMKEAAKIALIGSIGFGAGALTCVERGIIDAIQEYRKEAEMERVERLRYEQRMKQYVPPPTDVAPPRYGEGFYCNGFTCVM